MRQNGRPDLELRPVKITRNYLKHPEGSVLIEMGDTKVICTATVEESVPAHKKGSGEGWVTAEYGMLPRSTTTRMQREGYGRQIKGRTQEIQRLIGRSLRAVVNLGLLGERTITLDADVIQADGGTRTASITGSYVALCDAISAIKKKALIPAQQDPIKEFLAAVSVGMSGGKILVDLDYSEDSSADVDMNVVMTETGKFVEVQGTGESYTFSRKEMDMMLETAGKAIKKLITLQKEVLK